MVKTKNRQFRSKLTFLLITAMVAQMIFPFLGSHIYAAEPDQEMLEDTENVVSGPAITASGDDAGYIYSVKIKDEKGEDFTGEVKIDSKILIQYEYMIPDEEIVDTTKVYTLAVPPEITIIEEKEIDIKDGDRIVGKATAHTDNTITYQFTEEINNADLLFDRVGYFFIYSEFNEEEIGAGGSKDITFDVGGTNTTVVHVDFETIEETADVRLIKSGKYEKETNEITWTIVVTPETTPTRRPVSNVVIRDTIQNGQDYIEGSLKINPEVSGGKTTWDKDNKELIYEFIEDINTTENEKYTITFKTKVDTSLFDTEGKELTFKNQAAADFDGAEKPSISNEASVNTTVDFIGKDGSFDANTKRIKWIVTVNRNNLTIPDAKIVDVIPKGLTLDMNSVTLDGAKITDFISDSIEDGKTRLTYEFNSEIQENHVLEYYTDVDQDVFDSNHSPLFTNNAEFGGTGVPDNAKAGYGVNVTSSVINKTGLGYDRKTHIITWQVTVNSNKIGIKNAVVTDNIPVGLEYVDGSFKLNGTKVEDANLVYDAADSTDTGKTGTLTYTFPDTINDTYVIEFQTKVTDSNVYGVNGGRNFINEVRLTGESEKSGKSIDSTANATQWVNSEVIKKSGAGYDYATREITWKIVVNQNQMSIENAYVTDVIGEYQEFVPDSVTIGGKAAKKGSSATEKDSYYYDEGTRTLRYNFPEKIEEQLTIAFKTRIPDSALSIFEDNTGKTASNTGVLHGDDIPTVESTGMQNINNAVVSKKGNYTNGNDYIDWTVEINQNKVPMKNVILEDTLQEGLVLDTTSVKLISLVTNANGSYTENKDVTVDMLGVQYDISSREINFIIKGEVDSAYRLTFRTDIEEEYKNATFTNTITLKGSGSPKENTSAPIIVSFQAGGGGAGSSGRGSITITKVDKDDNSPLSGAVFELLDSYKNVIKISSETGEDGKAVFDKLKFGTYYIREKSSPTGYLLSDEEHEFQLTAEQKNLTYEFEDQLITGNIVFHKVDEDNLPLKGAEFTLYKEDDSNLEYPLSTAVSDEQGKVEFKNVPYGDYKIIETKAPEGYVISKDIIKAEVRENLVTVTTVPSSISNVKMKGSFKIRKVDESGEKPLANAKIGVYSESGTLIGEQITGEDGFAVFEKIPYGNYYFMETKAPAGYIRNTEKHEFAITSDGETVEVTFENRKYNSSDTHGDPGDSEKPKDPEEPKNPDDPGKTDDSGKPEKPEKPSKPGKPDNSGKPEKPSGTGKPGKTDDNHYGGGDKNPGDYHSGENKNDKIESLPKTGETSNIGFYIVGILMLFIGITLKKNEKFIGHKK